jgi:hypothetical protein
MSSQHCARRTLSRDLTKSSIALRRTTPFVNPFAGNADYTVWTSYSVRLDERTSDGSRYIGTYGWTLPYTASPDLIPRLAPPTKLAVNGKPPRRTAATSETYVVDEAGDAPTVSWSAPEVGAGADVAYYVHLNDTISVKTLGTSLRIPRGLFTFDGLPGYWVEIQAVKGGHWASANFAVAPGHF